MLVLCYETLGVADFMLLVGACCRSDRYADGRSLITQSGSGRAVFALFVKGILVCGYIWVFRKGAATSTWEAQVWGRMTVEDEEVPLALFLMSLNMASRK